MLECHWVYYSSWLLLNQSLTMGNQHLILVNSVCRGGCNLFRNNFIFWGRLTDINNNWSMLIIINIINIFDSFTASTDTTKQDAAAKKKNYGTCSSLKWAIYTNDSTWSRLVIHPISSISNTLGVSKSLLFAKPIHWWVPIGVIEPLLANAHAIKITVNWASTIIEWVSESNIRCQIQVCVWISVNVSRTGVSSSRSFSCCRCFCIFLVCLFWSWVIWGSLSCRFSYCFSISSFWTSSSSSSSSWSSTSTTSSSTSAS